MQSLLYIIVINQPMERKMIIKDIETMEDIAEQARKRADKDFKENTKNINFTLRGNNKYYYANQCKMFADFITKNGYPYIDKEDIIKDGVSFNKYSINIGYSQYNRDLKRFNSKEEMLGFVIGYNEATRNF